MSLYDLDCQGLIISELSATQLKALARAGRLRGADSVRTHGGDRWQQVSTVTQLAELVVEAPPRVTTDLASMVERALVEIGLSAELQSHGEGRSWKFTTPQGRLAACLLTDGAFAVICAHDRLGGRQLDDARLLERILRLNGSSLGASICIDDSDSVLVRYSRSSEDLDLSEIKYGVLCVMHVASECESRLEHLLR